jgi:ribosomal protein S6--L-glutamate ligase
MTRVEFLLGRAPGTGSILPDVLARLTELGAQVHTRQRASMALGDVVDADLLVLRGLDAAALRDAVALECSGVRCANRAAATALARDKAAAALTLRGAGVPVPLSLRTSDWAEAASWARGQAVVVKAVMGSRGAGVALIDDGSLPDAPPFAGPWLVEERIAHDGRDRKLYVVGDRVDGVLRRWPPRGLEDKLGSPLPVDTDLADLARRAAGALGLTLAGVDVVVGGGGPVVVDVNAFPGYKGVPGAAGRVAEHLWRLARQDEAEEVAPCAS